MNPTDTAVYEAPELQDQPQLVDSQPDPVKPYSVVRALIAAFVACINTHCNGVGANDADAKIGAFKAQLADDRDAMQNAQSGPAQEGDTLTLLEEDHLDSIFAQVKTNPSPITPLADAPAVDAEPEEEPVDTRPAPYPGVGGGISLSPERPEENVPAETEVAAS